VEPHHRSGLVICPAADDEKLRGRIQSAAVLCDATRMGGYVVLLCGRSFSGKSTVARKLQAALDGTVVSFDEINSERGLHGGQGIPIAEWARTNEMGTH
jgi:hypothetical protein